MLSLSPQLTFKHLFKKSSQSLEIPFGNCGGMVVFATIFSTSFASFDIFDQGGFPVSISITTHPTDQTSAAYVWPALNATSGAIQYGEPFNERFRSMRSSMYLEAPKSESFIVPSLSTKRFAHFISL